DALPLRDLEPAGHGALQREHPAAEIGGRGPGRRVLEPRGSAWEEKPREDAPFARESEHVGHTAAVLAFHARERLCAGGGATHGGLARKRHDELFAPGLDPKR